MVFSEAFSVAEELSKSEDGGRSASGSLLGDSPMVETQSLVPAQSWPDLHARAEDLDDEEIGDARSDLTLAGHLSPPVEELSLISLEDTPSVPAPNEGVPALPSEPSPEGPPCDPPAIESSPEEPIQVADAPEEDAPVDEPSPSEVVEPASGEENAASSEALTESTQILPGPEESIVESVCENVDPAPLANDEEPKDTEPYAESEMPLPPEPVLELNEPPPSEPIPPESESDITDEVGVLDGDEVREGGEEEVAAE